MKNYSTYQATVSAGDKLSVPRLGAYCRVLYSSQSYFNIAIGDDFPSRIEQGIGFYLPTGQEFNSITIDNPHAAILNFIMAFSDGKIDDNRMSISSVLQVKGEVGPSANSFNPISVLVGTVATQIIAANSLRTKSVLQAGALDLFVGPANSVTTANGFKIKANDAVVFEHRGAIFGVRASATEIVTGWEEVQ